MVTRKVEIADNGHEISVGFTQDASKTSKYVRGRRFSKNMLQYIKDDTYVEYCMLTCSLPGDLIGFNPRTTGKNKIDAFYQHVVDGIRRHPRKSGSSSYMNSGRACITDLRHQMLRRIRSNVKVGLKIYLRGMIRCSSTDVLLLPISAATSISKSNNRFKKWVKCANITLLCCLGFLKNQTSKSEDHPGCHILFHPIAQNFAKLKVGILTAKATIHGITKIGILRLQRKNFNEGKLPSMALLVRVKVATQILVVAVLAMHGHMI
ncbi:AAA+ ATPase domain-containing protein [Artemisia annua]|uniref:AAA+ ATPase domain-containing protein n=1 Tax=Artemisia annua TaxID=35608 RepID=A0A2U1MDT2_ARTAN|nr:AAA+ ATPase domain-containing protein [Artemisia annua]